ncbi:MAG: head-tail adaptor protein [Caulobacteraceae bacterium]|nr:head-tail adaptor protein [Caulobacteraceae bacterium]
MADNTPAANNGQLRFSVRFERRGLDANGDPLGDWRELMTLAARIQNLRGGEAVNSQRLEGNQPILVTVHACDQVRELTTADRVVNARTSQVFDIKAINEDERRFWTSVLAVSKGGGTPG